VVSPEEFGSGDGPLITSIELTPVFVPFNDFVVEAMSGAGGLGMAIAAEEPWLGGDFVICRLVAEDGTAGVGEAFLWLPETGAIPEQVISIIERSLGKYVLGRSPFDFESIIHRMEINATRNEVAKGLIDMACYDLMGRLSARPVCELIGGKQVEEVPLAALIPLMSPEAMAVTAKWFLADGWRTFRCKLGAGFGEDVRIMETVREAVGDRSRLRVDYNQAYTVPEAVEAIKAIEPLGIDVAEQPVGAFDFTGMAEVQRSVSIPLMAHEGCFSLSDIQTLHALGAIGVVGINSDRPGGMTYALRAVEFAERNGMGVVLHNQPLGIASAWQIHLAASRFGSLGHDIELFGQVMLSDDLIIEPIDYRGGSATVPEGSGWGVELDLDALGDHATGPTVIVRDH
jgi:muconate cycloisomerase